VAAADIVHFAHGVPGFESCRQFVLISAPELLPFTCLHGIDAPEPSFLTLDPRQVVAGYQPPLGAAERTRLAATSDEPLLWLAVVHVDDQGVTANLRAPIVINPRRMVGLQVLGADTAWATDHLLTAE
jgi:flagellar assembly factor FliW